MAVGHNRAATSNHVEKDKDTESHPCVSEDRTFILLQNGMVSNYQWLQEFLTLIGHDFATGIDSEVLLHLLEEIIRTSETREEAIKKAKR